MDKQVTKKYIRAGVSLSGWCECSSSAFIRAYMSPGGSVELETCAIMNGRLLPSWEYIVLFGTGASIIRNSKVVANKIIDDLNPS